MIYTKFWYDNYVSSLNAKEKLLFIYLISNEKVTICGIYEMPDKYILLDTGIRLKELNTIKQKFMDDGKFAFIDGWIKIMNFDSYNSFSGEKNDTAKEKELALIPDEILNFKYSIDRDIDRVSSKTDTLNNHNQYINHNKLDKKDTPSKVKHLTHVLLTNEEYQKLIEKFGKDKTAKKIDDLDYYIENNPKKGSKYKNHYRTILKWNEKDTADKGNTEDAVIKRAKSCYIKNPGCRSADMDKASCRYCKEHLR